MLPPLVGLSERVESIKTALLSALLLAIARQRESPGPNWALGFYLWISGFRSTTCASDACQVHAVSIIEPRSGKVESGFTVVPTLAVECEKPLR